MKKADYWSSQRISDKLLLSKEELKQCLDSHVLTIPEAPKEIQQSTNKRGRKAKFEDLKEKLQATGRVLKRVRKRLIAILNFG